MAVTASLIRALKPHIPVKMLLPEAKVEGTVRKRLAALGVSIDGVEMHFDSQARYMPRDSAVFLVDGQGRMQILDLQWSLYGLPGWCKKLYPDDRRRELACCEYLKPEKVPMEAVFAKALGASIVPSKLFLENATFEVNGKGVLLISEWLALERNPGMTRGEIEGELLKIPGIRKVVWLGHGLAQDPLERSTIEGRYVGEGAGGHTDEFVRFADPNTILLAWADPSPGSENPPERMTRERMQKNFEILSNATDQDGKPFRIIKIPMPSSIERPVRLAPNSDLKADWVVSFFPKSEGRKVGDELIQVAAASYLNFIVANKLVLVPSFVDRGTSAILESQVKKSFESAFPGREVQFIRASALGFHGGGPHCATLSEPRAD